MKRTEAGRKMRRYRTADRIARETGVPVEEVFGEREERFHADRNESMERSYELEPARERARAMLEDRVSRRDFIRRSGLVGAGVVATTMFGAAPSVLQATRAAAATAPRVVVVGAGFAGLTAAYRVYMKTGWVPQVYEAQDRVSGRVETIRGASGGQYTEECASGINTNELTGTGSIGALATELGLTPFVDNYLHYPGTNSGEVYHYLGKAYSWSQLSAGSTAIDNYAWAQWRKLGYIPTFSRNDAVAKALDAMSCEALYAKAGYPVTTPAGAYRAQLFGVEYGGQAKNASALHEVMEQGNFWGVDAGYDERWAIPGGNDMLASTLASKLPGGSIHLSQQLVAIKKNTDATYTLTFKATGGATTTAVVADRVVITLPPTCMKTVDYSGAGFRSPKNLFFQNGKLGDNAKMNMQFAGQPWGKNGHSGDAYTDMEAGSTWQASFLGTNPAWLVSMNNKDYGPLAGDDMSPSQISTMLAAYDKLWPGQGVSGAFISGNAWLTQRLHEPFSQGSYSYRGLNGFTTYGGTEGLREGRVYFAGEAAAPYTEHGMMGGAVLSGETAAKRLTSY
jgi:monoamine oxidase